MNIIVCVKQVPDPEAPPTSFKIDSAANKVVPAPSVKPVVSPFDEYGVEAALRLKDADATTKVSVLSAGKSFALDVIKKPLSMGADNLFLVQDDALENADSFTTASALAAAIKKIGPFDLILCGRQASDWDSGQVGSGLAELLGIPSVTVARKVEVKAGKARVERVLSDGYEVVEVSLPALITASNEVGAPRYPTLKGIMASKSKPVTTWKAADLGLDASKLQANKTKVLKLYQPVRESKVEFVKADTPADAGIALAQRLRQAKLL